MTETLIELSINIWQQLLTSFLAACQTYPFFLIGQVALLSRYRSCSLQATAQSAQPFIQKLTANSQHPKQRDPQTLGRGWHVSRLKKEGGDWDMHSHRGGDRTPCVASSTGVCMLNSIWDYMALGDLVVALCDDSQAWCITISCVHVHKTLFWSHVPWLHCHIVGSAL